MAVMPCRVCHVVQCCREPSRLWLGSGSWQCHGKSILAPTPPDAHPAARAYTSSSRFCSAERPWRELLTCCCTSAIAPWLLPSSIAAAAAPGAAALTMHPTTTSLQIVCQQPREPQLQARNFVLNVCDASKFGMGSLPPCVIGLKN